MAISLTPEQYLESLGYGCEIRRSQLNFASWFLACLHSTYTPAEELPVLWIDEDELVQAQQLHNRIYITTGLIDHCCAPPLISLRDCFSAGPLGRSNYNPAAEVALAWAIGHEFIHFAHRHREVEEIEGGNIATLQALEFDADLCSVAAIFRALQQRLGHLFHDIDLKRLTAYCIFWALRTMPVSTEQTDHGELGARLLYMLQKLAIIPVDPTSRADASFEHEESRQTLTVLFDLAVQMDTALLQMCGHSGMGTSLVSELSREILKSEAGESVVCRWESLRVSVMRLNKSNDWYAEHLAELDGQGAARPRARKLSEEEKFKLVQVSKRRHP